MTFDEYWPKRGHTFGRYIFIDEPTDIIARELHMRPVNYTDSDPDAFTQSLGWVNWIDARQWMILVLLHRLGIRPPV